MKIAKLTVGAAAVLLSAQATAQDGEPMYHTIFYADAAHTQQVGYLFPECTARGVRYHLNGTYTYYTEDELIGTCGPNGPEPL